MAFSASAIFRPILLAGLLFLTQSAWAELMLHPTRLVFDKNQRAAQIELINNGSTPATYRISLVNRRMLENGQFEAADMPAPGEQFADPMLRYSPRQITLQPGGAQTVRVMLRKPAELAEGEYRSHLQFELLPEVEGANSIESRAGGKDIGVVLNTLVGASVPVIVRQGATNATVRLSGLALARVGKQPVSELHAARRQAAAAGASGRHRRVHAEPDPQGSRAAAGPERRRTGARHHRGELPRPPGGGRQGPGPGHPRTSLISGRCGSAETSDALDWNACAGAVAGGGTGRAGGACFRGGARGGVTPDPRP